MKVKTYRDLLRYGRELIAAANQESNANLVQVSYIDQINGSRANQNQGSCVDLVNESRADQNQGSCVDQDNKSRADQNQGSCVDQVNGSCVDLVNKSRADQNQGSCVDQVNESRVDQIDARLLLCAVTRRDIAGLYVIIDDEADPVISEEYLRLIDRRAKNEPVQYIIGTCGFMSLDFDVDRRVMIPRSDTETLVEHLINVIKRSHIHREKCGTKSIKILDICTGSGCIATSLANYLDNVKVIGVDISTEAIDLARKNADKHSMGDRVEFIECDIFDDKDLNKLFDLSGIVDIICSNPPYIPTSQLDGLMPGVRDFEPASALDGGKDGLDFYWRITERMLPSFISGNGFVAFEVGVNQADSVKKILHGRFPQSSTYTVKDISGIERVVCGDIAAT